MAALATVFRDHRHCREQGWGGGNVTSPKRAGPASPGRLHTQILGDTESGNVCRRDLFIALATPTCVHVPQEQFEIVGCFEMHVAFAQLPMHHWWSPHERIFAKLMSACHIRRLQSSCKRNGAPKKQFGEGAVCLSVFRGAAITNPSTLTAHATIASALLFLIHENGCCCVSSTHVTCSTHVFLPSKPCNDHTSTGVRLLTIRPHLRKKKNIARYCIKTCHVLRWCSDTDAHLRKGFSTEHAQVLGFMRCVAQGCPATPCTRPSFNMMSV